MLALQLYNLSGLQKRLDDGGQDVCVPVMGRMHVCADERIIAANV